MIISIKVNAQIIMQSIDFESERIDYNKDNKWNSSNYTQIHIIYTQRSIIT